MTGPKLEPRNSNSSPPRRWRPVLRSLHRDAGYLAVGLTLVYAISGLAVNHIGEWDPDYVRYRRVHTLPAPLPNDAQAAAALIRARLGIREVPREVYRAGPEQLDLLFERRTLHANPATGRVVDQGQEPRFFLRFANWLHLNRGKKAWRIVADLYAVFLLFLALSGMVMLPGRLGLRGRGGVMVLLGIAVPVLYVVLSGGPNR